jgi:hypothetical protein
VEVEGCLEFQEFQEYKENPNNTNPKAILEDVLLGREYLSDPITYTLTLPPRIYS